MLWLPLPSPLPSLLLPPLPPPVATGTSPVGKLGVHFTHRTLWQASGNPANDIFAFLSSQVPEARASAKSDSFLLSRSRGKAMVFLHQNMTVSHEIDIDRNETAIQDSKLEASLDIAGPIVLAVEVEEVQDLAVRRYAHPQKRRRFYLISSVLGGVNPRST